MAKRDIVAIGGSAGSTQALKEIATALPADFPGSVFITTHLSSEHRSYLPDLLGHVSALPVASAVDGQPVEPGRIYVAPPDRHLLLLESTVRLGIGPRENMSRPAIDPMFRSAALSRGPRVVGVVLSGLLNDGASGLLAVKEAGGVAIVQHPLDALEDEMPRAALEAVDVDHVARASDIAGLLTDLAKTDAPGARPVSERLVFEVEVANGSRLGPEALRRFAEPATLTCPDCQGVLSEVRGDKPLRYRCQIGHAYTAQALIAQHERIDEALRVALRILEERVALVERMARDARNSGRTAVAELYERRAAEHRRHAGVLRDAALLSLRTSLELNEP